MTGRSFLFAAGALAALGATPASAIHMDGDNYIDDLQKNPALLEPYSDESRVRYRASNPKEGLEDRRQAARGGPYWGSGSSFRGEVRVRPFNPFE